MQSVLTFLKKRLLLYVLLFTAGSCLLAFEFVQIHHQSQTEYLIYYDFWRNFAALKTGAIYPFIYHNIHMYAVPSAIWYLDVLLAHGNLKFAHAYVLVATLLALFGMGLLVRKLYVNTNASSNYVTLIGIMAAALWLSPANATSFSYPLVDILACTLLLLLNLTVFITTRAESHRHWHILVAYFFINCIGFLTLETFVIVPLILTVYFAAQRVAKQSIFHICLAICLVSLYLIFLPASAENSPVSASAPRNISFLAQNFCILLSTHYGLLFNSLGINALTANRWCVWLAVGQLVWLILFAWQYAKATMRNCAFLFPWMLIIFGIVSIASATWLRFGSGTVSEPVDRYSVYSLMFSLGIFLLATTAIPRKNDLISLCSAMIIFSVNGAYLLAEAETLRQHSATSAEYFMRGRLEMAAFALNPGQERSLGPAEADGGLQWRANLHDFLLERKLSVFSSNGWSSIGTRLNVAKTTSDQTCARRRETRTRDGDNYSLVAFTGVADDGIFLVTDSDLHITNFSFSARLTLLDDYVLALLPSHLKTDDAVFHVRVYDDQLFAVQRCRLEN